MTVSELASRYARALYDLAKENGSIERVFNELRGLRSILLKDKESSNYFSSPLVRASEKEATIKETLTGKGLSSEVEDFACLLARKNRFQLFDEVVEGFQMRADTDNGVSRGTVKSAAVLMPEERTKIEELVSKATGKRVILTYQEDPSMIGGLVAQVGGYTFDDSIVSHLRRLQEELNRRTH